MREAVRTAEARANVAPIRTNIPSRNETINNLRALNGEQVAARNQIFVAERNFELAEGKIRIAGGLELKIRVEQRGSVEGLDLNFVARDFVNVTVEADAPAAKLKRAARARQTTPAHLAISADLERELRISFLFQLVTIC